VEDSALSPAERDLLRALHARGARFIIVGLTAAVIEGAPVSTQDIDLWLESPGSEPVRLAAADAGGFWISGAGLQPPALGGPGLDRIDVVLAVHGLETFDVEFARALSRTIDDIPVKVLPLERVILSKRTTNRPKDRAALPALEATQQARGKAD
jgi:predicted nucleotidyltransferase